MLLLIKTLISDMYLFGDPLNRQTFRGSFVATSWGTKDQILPEVKENVTREGELRQAIIDSFSKSELRSCFVTAEVLAIDKLVQFFNEYSNNNLTLNIYSASH